jgi:GntR family transcriptional regulator
LNRFLTRPLYLQLRDALVERIARGEWKAGAMVPNELDLAREFGVSPGTIRKALELMETMRLLTRRQGRGTFVNDQSSLELAARYSNLRGADGESLPDDVETGEVTEAPANELERRRLGLAQDERVYRFRRRRVRVDRTSMVEDVSVPAALFAGLGGEQGPIPAVTALAMRYGVLLGKAEERVAVGTPPPEIAGALGVAPGTPVLTLDRVVFAVDGRAVEWRMGCCHLADGHYLAEIG